MARTSAGILLYRFNNKTPEVLLVHPGGPFWKNKDLGAWSIPKGEVKEGEDLLATARREFEEEIGVAVDGDFLPLAPIKQKSGKIVHAFAVQGDIDTSAIKSNTCLIEWPPRSGKQIEIPEIDRAEFFDIPTARTKINLAQAALLEGVDANTRKEWSMKTNLIERQVAKTPRSKREDQEETSCLSFLAFFPWRLCGLAFISILSLSARADWPVKVFIPYMYLGAGDDFKLTDCIAACGQKTYTLAFIIADQQNNPAWDGRWPIEQNLYADQIDAIRKAGGDCVVSFGGEAGKEIALVEPDIEKLQAKYQAVIDRYHFTWLDFDIEGKAMANHEANHRRNTVLKNLQAKYPNLIISFTIPVDPDGINDNSTSMISDAVQQGVKVHSANIMTMYFGPKFNKKMSMVDMCTKSADKAHEQTTAIDPKIQIGLCPMIGHNGQMHEDFTVDDAKQLADWSSKQPWVCSLSFWCSNRDANQAKKKDDNTNSGVAQEPWAFSKALQPFASP